MRSSSFAQERSRKAARASADRHADEGGARLKRALERGRASAVDVDGTPTAPRLKTEAELDAGLPEGAKRTTPWRVVPATDGDRLHAKEGYEVARVSRCITVTRSGRVEANWTLEFARVSG